MRYIVTLCSDIFSKNNSQTRYIHDVHFSPQNRLNFIETMTFYNHKSGRAKSIQVYEKNDN